MGPKKRILYIEDDAKSRTLVTKVLDREFDVQTAATGLEGLDLVERWRPDLVLTDINLPDLSGEIIAARVRVTAGTPLPIVAISGNIDKSARDRALAAGCIGLITKPVNTRELVDTIHGYLSGRIDNLPDHDRHRATAEIHVEITRQLEQTVRQLQQDNAELRSLERVRTAFLTQVAHDLRTPLTVLSGYVQMLHRQLHSDSSADPNTLQLSALSVESLDHLQRTINEIVTMARLSTKQMEAFLHLAVIGPIVRQAIAGYQDALAERQITLTTDGDGWQCVLLVDAVLVRMAISNLLSNAIKFTPDQGQITVRVRLNVGEVLHISIIDTGIGIAPDMLRMLFKPSYPSIDPSRGHTSKTAFMSTGMGIGLTIVAKIAEAHNGRVWAESKGFDEEKRPGSTFHLLLPGARHPTEEDRLVLSYAQGPTSIA